MRGLLMVVVVVGSVGSAAADRPAVRVPSKPAAKGCQRAAAQLAATLALEVKVQQVVARRCEKDRWSPDVQTCLANAMTSTDAALCVDRLARPQRTELEGDADRVRDLRLSRMLFRRSLIANTAAPAPMAPMSAMPLVTLASLPRAGVNPPRSVSGDTSHTAGVGRARSLQTQGLSAYQAGRYDFAVRKFAEALDAAPTSELLYHAAQAYRLKGERAKALEHYELYIEVAPDGPAAPSCRSQIERLRDVP